MPTLFESKIRRLGKSMIVTVPKEILKEVGSKEGDTVKVLIVPKRHQVIERKREILESLAGIYANAQPFVRDRRDRLS